MEKPSRLARVHSLVKDARTAESNGEITVEHFRKVDQAISEELAKLSFFQRPGGAEGSSESLRWTRPDDQPPERGNLASAHGKAIEQLQEIAKDEKTGTPEDPTSHPINRAELKSVFGELGDEGLRQLLEDVPQPKSVRKYSSPHVWRAS